MAEPRKPPQEFLDWLNKSYGWVEQNAWLAKYTWPFGWNEDWMQDPVYQQWEQNVAPQSPQAQGISKTEVIDNLDLYGYLDRIKKTTSVAELDRIIDEAMVAGIIPDEEMGITIFDTYAYQQFPIKFLQAAGVPDETLGYLANYVDKGDLLRRIQSMDLPANINPELLYGGLAGMDTSDYAKARRKQYGEETGQYQAEVGRRQQRDVEVEQAVREYGIKQLQDAGLSMAEIAPLLDLHPQDMITEGLKRSDNKALGAGGMTYAEQRVKKQADMSKAGPGYRSEAQAFLNAFNNQRAREPIKAMPSLPSNEPLIKGFQRGIPYGEGTRLRSFLESQIPETVRNMQPVRESWWRRMNTPEPQGESYDEAMGRLQSEGSRLSALAGSAPTGSYLGGTYFGEGGPAAAAQMALDYNQQNIANLNPEDYSGGFATPMNLAPPPEDPLKAALEKLMVGYKPKYYRQPGTGMAGRLQPSLRFR